MEWKRKEGIKEKTWLISREQWNMPVGFIVLEFIPRRLLPLRQHGQVPRSAPLLPSLHIVHISFLFVCS